MSVVKKLLLANYSPSVKIISEKKVTVVGAGQVGMACVFSLITRATTHNIVLINRTPKKAQGEVMDLHHAAPFLGGIHINGGSDYALSADSSLCIVTAGVRQAVGESRLSLLQRNVDVLKEVIPNLVKHSPNTVIMMVSNPVDILTYIAWKISGLPKSKVFGSGTNLDTTRFRTLLSDRLDISARNCHAFIIGEHGDMSIPVWSGASIAGVRLSHIYPQIGTDKDKENLTGIHKEVVNAAYEVIKLKGYTSWAIGLSAAAISASILHDTNNVHPVSVDVRGLYGIDYDVFLSLPAVLTTSGVVSIVKLKLNKNEETALRASAAELKKLMDKVQI